MARNAYSYCVIDIETGNAPEEQVRKWFEATWKPRSNYKDAKVIEKARAEAWESAREKASLMPDSPIIAIASKSEGELRCLHCMREQEPMVRQIGNCHGLVQGFRDEAAMLAAMCGLFAEKVDSETVLAGFNVKWFDFPKIRLALARRKMALPEALLNPEQAVYDNMEKYCRLYSGERDVFANCAEVSTALGIEPHKVSGAVVPQLYAAGEIEAVCDKALLDVLEEEQQFLRMTGRAR